MATLDFLEIADLRGGRNGADPPRSIPDNQVVEALNVDWWDGTVGRRRGGATSVSLASAPFTGTIDSLFRHLPTEDEYEAEIWGTDSAFKIGRYVSGGWTTITPTDAISANPTDVAYTSLNNKLFVAHKSAQDRLHVWDGTTLRRVGVKAPTAAPTTSLAAGAVSDNRKYKSVATVQSAGVTIRRSEPSTATGVISPAAQKVTVTLAGAPSEGETHWELYGASDDDSYATYWLLGTAAIGSTIDDNNSLVSTATGTAINVTGTYTTPWSAKYVLSDENRLLFAGSWEQEALASRIGFSSVIGATNVSDDERYPSTSTQSNYIDLDRGDGGGITGLGGPLNGSPYVFKYGQIYKLVRTGISTSPYVPVTISKTVGCLRHQSIVAAEDENGASALYFLSREGPYRVGPRGLQFIGGDIRDIWATVNLAATGVVTHGVYHASKHQIWWFVATGAANNPDVRIVHDCRLGLTTAQGVRQGWAKHTGDNCSARCSAMLPTTFGATQSLGLSPHIGQAGGNARLWRCDTSDLNDNGTVFEAYVTSKPYAVAKVGKLYGVTDLYLLAKALAATTVYCKTIRDFGLETRTFSTSIAPSASEDHVIKQFEDAAMGEAMMLQFRIGDNTSSSTPAGQWTLDQLSVRLTLEEASN